MTAEVTSNEIIQGCLPEYGKGELGRTGEMAPPHEHEPPDNYVIGIVREYDHFAEETRRVID